MYRSSGICGARPAVLRIRRILLPVTDLTWATPCESRRTTPIWDGVRPLRASLKMCSLTSSGDVLSQRGAERLYGSADEACRGMYRGQSWRGKFVVQG